MKVLKKVFERLVHLRMDMPLNPEAVLVRAVDQAPDIQAVVIVKLWKDGTVDVAWSQMKVKELAFCQFSMQQAVTRALNTNGG